MSIKEKCSAGIRDAYGRNMSDAEIEDFVSDIELRAKNIRAKDASLSMTDALEKAATDKGNMIKMAAIAKKRATYIGFRRHFEAVEFIETSFLGREHEGLYSRVVATEGGEGGSRISSGNEQRMLHQSYMAALNNSLSRVTPDFIRAFKDPMMRADIAETIARLSDGKKDFSDLDPTAVKLGEAVSKVDEIARSDHNKAGGFIGKAKGYVASQKFWDALNISKNIAEFRRVMREDWDWEEMGYYTQKDIDAAMPYFERNMATGVHLGQADTIPQAKGLQGMARGLAQERVIHFKTSAGYLNAMDKFGHGGLFETIASDLAKSAKSTGMMRIWGPNHIATFDKVVDTVARRIQQRGGDPSAFINESKSVMKNHIREQDGSLDIPGNELGARIGATGRAVESLAHLPNSFAASMNDIGTAGLAAKYNGLNFVENIFEMMRGWVEGIPDADKLDVLADLGVYFDSHAASLAIDRSSVDPSVSGWVGKGQEYLYQLNLQNRMTNGGQNGLAHVLARNLARNSKKGFANLDKEFQVTLGSYNIDAGKWDIIRSVTKTKDYTGADIVTPSQLRELPDDVWKKYLDDNGRKSSKFAIDELREETFRQLRGYMVDQIDYGVLSAGAKTRGIVKMGTNSGTWAGEGARTGFQFKSFPIEFYHRIIKREFLRGNAASATARLLLFTGTVGIISNYVTDLINGKTPRISSQSGLKTFRDGLLRGGAGGIYGDIINTIMSSKNPSDAPVAAIQLAGPVAGDVFGRDGLVSIANRASRSAYYRSIGDEDEANKQDFASTTLRFAQSNAPLINYFMAKQAINYMFMYKVQEALNPGTLERMEQRLQEDTGQEYIVPPSETVQ